MGTVVTEMGHEILRFQGTTEEKLNYLHSKFWELRGELNNWADWDIQEQLEALKEELQEAQGLSAKRNAENEAAFAVQNTHNKSTWEDVQRLQNSDQDRARDYRVAEHQWTLTQNRV